MDSLKFFKVVCISTLSLAFLLHASIPAFAQAGSTGRIIGSITDSTGAVIGGATISVTDTQYCREVELLRQRLCVQRTGI